MSNEFSFPRFKAIDGNGNPIRGGKLSTYAEGTSTDKAAYSDAARTVEHTNPIILNSEGEALIYLLGAYKMNLTTSADAQVPGWPIDNLGPVGGELAAGNYPNSGAADHGVTGDSDTIKYFVDTIGATNKATIYLRHDSGGEFTGYVFSTAETIPSNITLEFEPGARLDPDNAIVVTLNCPITAAPQEIFTGSGTITFGNAGTAPPLNIQWWDGDNLGDKYNLAVEAAPTDGGTILIPPGEYTTSTELVYAGPDVGQAKSFAVWAYGVVIKTTGAISGFKLTNNVGKTNEPTTIYGLTIDHDDNADAVYGFELSNTWNVRLKDCTIVANAGTGGGSYAGVALIQSDPADSNKGSIWTTLENVWFRPLSGSIGGSMQTGILLRGAANAFLMKGGGIGGTINAIHVTVESGQTNLISGFVVDGVAFENYVTAVLVEGATTSNIVGHRFVNNRFEGGNDTVQVYSYITTTTQPSQAPFAAGNMYSANSGTYLNNPNNLYFTSLDQVISPDYSGDTMTWKQDTKIIARSAANDPLKIVPAGGSRGIAIRNSSDNANALQLLWLSGNLSIIQSITGGVPNLAMVGVKGINGSGTTVLTNNLRGQVTFTGAATKAVSFGTNEDDASYFISLSGNVNETFFVTNKATTGFTLNSSNGASVAVVDWHLIR